MLHGSDIRSFKQIPHNRETTEGEPQEIPSKNLEALFNDALMTQTTQTSFTKLPPMENGDEDDGKAEQDQEAVVS
jgi:hypothetical protein